MSIIRLTEIKSDLSSRDLWINTAHIVCFETIPDLNRGEMYERPAFGRISTTVIDGYWLYSTGSGVDATIELDGE